MFVVIPVESLVSCVVAVGRRRHLSPTLLSSCRRLFVFRSSIHFSVTVIYFYDGGHFTSPLLPTTHPLPLVPAQTFISLHYF